MPQTHSEEAVRAVLKTAILKAGSARKWASGHGLSAAYAIDVRDGRRPAGARILAALGLERRIVSTEGDRP